MNANKPYVALIVALSLALIASLAVGAGSPRAEPPAPNAPLGTAFTYQGRLTDDAGLPVDGTCDFQFSLWDDPDAGSQVGSTLDVAGVVVTKGLFTAALDFGGVFDGTTLWLKIAVRCAGDPSYIDLSPRQELTAAPFALNADKLDGSHAAAFALAAHSHSSLDAPDGSPTQALLVDNDARVGIGTGSSTLGWDGLEIGVGGSGTPTVFVHGVTDRSPIGVPEIPQLSTYIYGGPPNETDRFGIGQYYGLSLVAYSSNTANYGTIKFFTGGGAVPSAERMRVNNVGNVGIGTDAPAYKLDVAGAIRVTDQILSTIASGTAPLAIASTTLVTNLNADLLDGQHGTYYQSASNINAGTLGTSYYSAYSDLSAEGYLDNNADADLPTRLQADGRYVNEGQANSVTSGMITDGQVASGDLQDGAALAEILDDDGSGSTLDADTVDGYHGLDLARVSYGTLYPATGSVSIEIPNWTPFTLHLSSGWPRWGGLALVQGFENDDYVAVTWVQYNGDGTSAYGGAECYEGDTTTILTFGSGSYTYTVRCPGEAGDPHNLVLTAAGVELRWSLTY